MGGKQHFWVCGWVMELLGPAVMGDANKTMTLLLLQASTARRMPRGSCRHGSCRIFSPRAATPTPCRIGPRRQHQQPRAGTGIGRGQGALEVLEKGLIIPIAPEEREIEEDDLSFMDCLRLSGDHQMLPLPFCPEVTSFLSHSQKCKIVHSQA